LRRLSCSRVVIASLIYTYTYIYNIIMLCKINRGICQSTIFTDSQCADMCQQLPRGRVLRRRTSEVRKLTGYHRGSAERPTVGPSTTGMVKVAARCACCSASGLLLVCQQRAYGRGPRRRAGEAHKLTGYHECSAERASESFTPPWSAEQGSTRALEGMVRFAPRCARCSASGSLWQVPWQEAVMQSS